MKLTPENVYQYLHKRKTIDEAAAVKGHFMVHPVATRNTIMKLLIGAENSLFVMARLDCCVYILNFQENVAFSTHFFQKTWELSNTFLFHLF